MLPSADGKHRPRWHSALAFECSGHRAQAVRLKSHKSPQPKRKNSAHQTVFQVLLVSVGFELPICFCVVARHLGTLGSFDSQRETSLRQKRLSTVLCLALPLPSPKVVEMCKARSASKKKEKTHHKGVFSFFLVAGVGFEPHDLRVMSPTSYQTAPSRDISGAGSRGRTGTRNKSHGILSPGRLPIPPFRHF